MSENKIEERVKKLVGHVLKIDAKTVKDESHFVADLGAESIQSVELIAAFEEEFDVEMDEDAALSVQTVGEAVEFIRKCVKEQHK